MEYNNQKIGRCKFTCKKGGTSEKAGKSKTKLSLVYMLFYTVVLTAFHFSVLFHFTQ